MRIKSRQLLLDSLHRMPYELLCRGWRGKNPRNTRREPSLNSRFTHEGGKILKPAWTRRLDRERPLFHHVTTGGSFNFSTVGGEGKEEGLACGREMRQEVG